MLVREFFEGAYWNGLDVQGFASRVPYVETTVRDSGVYRNVPVSTIKVGYEEMHGAAEVIPFSPRGGAIPALNLDKDKVWDIRTHRIAQRTTITKDQIIGLIQVGGNVVASLNDLVTRRFAALERNVAMTEEHMDLGMLSGLVIDKDGSEKDSIFDLTGIAKPADVTFSVGTEAIKKACTAIRRTMVKAMMVPSQLAFKIVAYCGDSFYDFIGSSKEVKEAFNRPGEGQFLREGAGAYSTIYYAGVEFINYPGNGTVGPADDEAIFFPMIEGVGNTFLSPSDRIDAVEGPGLERYAFIDVSEDKTHLKLLLQTNRVSVFSQPGALVKGKLGS